MTAKRNYLTPVSRSLRPQPEKIRADPGPDVTLADVISRFIREGIDRCQKKES